MAQGPVSCGSYELGRGPWGHAWKGLKADSRRRFRTSQHSSAEIIWKSLLLLLL